MDPCRHPKSMKTLKKTSSTGCPKTWHFEIRFHAILVSSWSLTWPQGGALDGPKLTIAPKSRARRPPTRFWALPEINFLDCGEFFGNRSPRPPKVTPWTSQNQPKMAAKIIRNDLGSILCRVHFSSFRLVQNHLNDDSYTT